jgi:hypothetical protein
MEALDCRPRANTRGSAPGKSPARRNCFWQIGHCRRATIEVGVAGP